MNYKGLFLRSLRAPSPTHLAETPPETPKPSVWPCALNPIYPTPRDPKPLNPKSQTLNPKPYIGERKAARGSKYPNSRVLGAKIHTLNGFWTLKPYYLGTWTLRDQGLNPKAEHR